MTHTEGQPERAEIGGEGHAACPVCESPAVTFREPAPGWGAWWQCEECTLEFVKPRQLPASPQTLYDAAYRGQRRDNAMLEFHDRLRQRRALIDVDPTLWFWSPAFNQILEWLKRRLSVGDTVLEVGCGLGFFLHALRRQGFDAVGLDVAQAAVELNRADGFRVWHGEVESVPDGWVDPKAVVCMFMLHHVPDPMRLISAVREKWPAAGLAIAQYGPSNRTPPASLPPRTLTYWNGRALGTALRRAGYRCEVSELAGTGQESAVLRPVRKVAKQAIRLPPVYRLLRRVERGVGSKLSRPLARQAYVVLALAEPSDAVSSGADLPERPVAGSR